MKFLRIFICFFLVSSCSTTRVTYDYDHTVDFSKYQTYSLYPELHSGLNPFDEERLLRSLSVALREKGLRRAENPDFYVNVFTEQFREESRNSIGIGIGGGGGNMGIGVSGGFPIGGPDTYLRIIIDFIDAPLDTLIWQAVIESKFENNVSPEKQQAQFNKIISEALEEYPPEED